MVIRTHDFGNYKIIRPLFLESQNKIPLILRKLFQIRTNFIKIIDLNADSNKLSAMNKSSLLLVVNVVVLLIGGLGL